MVIKNKISEIRDGIGDIIIATILSNKNIAEFDRIIKQREFARYSKESVRVTLSRLHTKGYLNNSPNGWSLTKNGKLYARKNFLFSYIPSPFEKNAPANTIISFDIPGPSRTTRDWLRNQIKIFNYKMLQQSLWLGPGPLPNEFLKRLNDLGIRDNIKIFPIKKKGD